ncbi:hypothetical protein [Mycoplasma phocoenae]|uniref:Atypical Rib domain-containing protein n=1 Tax=Mycoplasma phocoenae TaxID=754517 RepID=A0A858U8Y3_9MOLU|nr:hypothetical protein [Mycoplasma phocoenae]QJG67178.1 hypothetical protein HGG69_02595 [Mycoplasma phocoenae]
MKKKLKKKTLIKLLTLTTLSTSLATNSFLLLNLNENLFVDIQLNNFALTKVVDINNISESEKKNIKENIKSANKSLNLTDEEIFIDNKGNVTIKRNGLSPITINMTRTVELMFIEPPRTLVESLTNIKDSEVAKIKESIKNANASLNLSDDQIIVNKSTGEVTVTPSAGKEFVITTDKATYVLPELTPVANSTDIQDSEVAKIKESIKNANASLNLSDDQIIVNKSTGEVTVTPSAGKEFVITTDKATYVLPELTPVANSTDIQDSEVAKIKESIKNANASLNLSDDQIIVNKSTGEVTVTPSAGKKFVITTDKATYVLPELTPVANSTDIQDSEVAKIKESIKNANVSLNLSDDQIIVNKSTGEVTVTPSAGKKFVITTDKATYVLPELTPVANSTDIQDSEVAKIKESIKNANVSLNLSDDQIIVNKLTGEVTVTPSAGKKFVITTDKATYVLPELTPVANSTDIQDSEEAKIKESIKNANASLNLSDDQIIVNKSTGEVTVTPSAGKKFVITTDKATYVLPELTPVANSTDIQDSEEAKIKESIKNANASLNLSDDQIIVNKSTGEVTVTPSAGKKFVITTDKATYVLPELTPVANSTDIQDSEEAKIKESIKNANASLNLSDDQIIVNKLTGEVTVTPSAGKEFTIPADKAIDLIPIATEQVVALSMSTPIKHLNAEQYIVNANNFPNGTTFKFDINTFGVGNEHVFIIVKEPNKLPKKVKVKSEIPPVSKISEKQPGNDIENNIIKKQITMEKGRKIYKIKNIDNIKWKPSEPTSIKEELPLEKFIVTDFTDDGLITIQKKIFKTGDVITLENKQTITITDENKDEYNNFINKYYDDIINTPEVPQFIPDPDDKKPEDWNEEMDGKYQISLIYNHEYVPLAFRLNLSFDVETSNLSGDEDSIITNNNLRIVESLEVLVKKQTR